MPKTILTVTLNPAIDKTVQVEKFAVGQDVYEHKIHSSAGGKGLNVSRTLKSLGCRSLAMGFLGGFSGRFIQKELTKERIKNDFIFAQSETRTNLTVINSANNTITRVLERGANINKQEIKEFYKKYSALLSRCNFAVFSGSLPQGINEDIYARLIKMAQRKNVKTVLDTSGKPLAFGLQAAPFLIKPNLQEAQSVMGYALNSNSAIEAAVKYFHKKGVKIVIISLDRKGAVASDGKEILLARAPKLRCKNNVGCGDALLAGFITALQSGRKLMDCLILGVACGAANTLTLQPGLVHKNSVIKIMKRIRVKKVA